MGIFDLFKKTKVELTEEQRRWNKMWDLWTRGNAEPPYAQLMRYYSEVMNGGHGQYFSNIENDGGFEKELPALETVLSEKLVEQLRRAYKAYLAEGGSADEILEQCDDVFYDHEDEISGQLKGYASSMPL